MALTYWKYLENQAEACGQARTVECNTVNAWSDQREAVLHSFKRSMGLDPMPVACDLALRKEGTFQGHGYTVQKMTYQLFPDCWNSGLLYTPDPLPEAKMPGVLFLCGHHRDGLYGYRHHAENWARRGYACFIINTIEQGGGPGDHHGLYKGERPDWISYGYTAAGGELYNGIRALDVLSDEPSVDSNRLGVTGNSGGGAQSFFLSIIDPRIKVLATSCGVVSLPETITQRSFMDHCDCMYPHNWDQLNLSDFGTLLAPKPVLFCFARHDTLFSPSEYQHAVDSIRKVYQLYGKSELCALFEYDGPHGYSDESVQQIDLWFDKHLPGVKSTHLNEKPGVASPATHHILKDAPTTPNRLGLLPELLSPEGGVEFPRTLEDWPLIQETVKSRIRDQIFHKFSLCSENTEWRCLGNWLAHDRPCQKFRGVVDGMDLLVISSSPKKPTKRLVVGVADKDETAWDVYGRLLSDVGDQAVVAAIEPRLSGFGAYPKSQEHHFLRAGILVGVTPLMLTIQDILFAVEQLQKHSGFEDHDVFLAGRGDAAAACLYSALMGSISQGLILEQLPRSHRDGAYLPGILKIMDIPHLVGLMAPKFVGLVSSGSTYGQWGAMVYGHLNVPDQLMTASCFKTAWQKALDGPLST